jgi:superfamily II DNA helicase RecQ
MEEKYGVKAHFVTPFSNPTASADLSSVLSNRNNNDAIQVLTVTPETFASKEFQSWYKPFEGRDRSQQNGYLEVIALDEVHSMLSCSDDRSEYAEIISYIGINVPIVMLSGSLTIKYEIELLKKIESRCNGSLCLIRLPMNRANIFNHIVLVEENFKKELSWLVVLMEYFSSDPSQFPVSIIYFNSIDTMSKVFEWFYHASPLGFQDRIFKFYSNAGDETYRSEKNRVFLKTDIYKVGFATSSLGQGIDKSNIRIQISWGASREIDHYIQAFGRAGRDAFKKQLNMTELSDEMALLVNSNDCRRKTI